MGASWNWKNKKIASDKKCYNWAVSKIIYSQWKENLLYKIQTCITVRKPIEIGGGKKRKELKSILVEASQVNQLICSFSKHNYNQGSKKTLA